MEYVNIKNVHKKLFLQQQEKNNTDNNDKSTNKISIFTGFEYENKKEFAV